MDWVCDEAWIPTLSQSLFFAGSIPGTLFFGWFSDYKGRLPTIIISNIIAFVTGIAIPFVSNAATFLALRFTMGLSFTTHFYTVYILGEFRQIILMYGRLNQCLIQLWNMSRLPRGL